VASVTKIEEMRLNRKTARQRKVVLWEVRYKTIDRQTRRRRFTTEAEANQFAATVRTKKATGELVDTKLGRRLLSDYAEGYLATKVDLRPRTKINVDGRFRNHILPMFGSRQIATIRPEDVRRFVSELTKKGLAPSTVKATYLNFSQMMATAELDGVIGRTPCLGIKLPKDIEQDEMLYLTPEQVTKLANAVDDRYRALIYTAAYAGLRAGELYALRVDRVDFLKRQIRVVEAISEVRGKVLTGPTKTGKVRTVTIAGDLADLLADHVRRYPSHDGYIFTAAQGGPVRHRNFYRRHFTPAVLAAGLPERLRFHDLRHSAASILASQGYRLDQVKDVLGHSSIRVTERYSHLFEGHADTLIDKVNDTFRNALGSSWGHEAPVVPIQDAQ
jgi:integrase